MPPLWSQGGALSQIGEEVMPRAKVKPRKHIFEYSGGGWYVIVGQELLGPFDSELAASRGVAPGEGREAWLIAH